MSEQRELSPISGGKLGDLWCRLMHTSPMWPIHGSYQCRECGRSYPVPWAVPHIVQPAHLAIRPEERVAESRA